MAFFWQDRRMSIMSSLLLPLEGFAPPPDGALALTGEAEGDF
jgi:hypothetical protein